MTQWFVRSTTPAKTTSRSSTNLKPSERQIPFDGAFVTAGNACTSPQRASSRAISSTVRTASLAKPCPWSFEGRADPGCLLVGCPLPFDDEESVHVGMSGGIDERCGVIQR